ncbi:MAG: tRNA uridine-5-carboxymethylaminomethyl(34) synthesis GTPase MnmE [Gemmatimonadota bacterium]|nr:MAG: tRNA uridine-5-carboxymethylaminomethyl(34) synthesis GTPase MnmE [Gemmatimonadota bacterium]
MDTIVALATPPGRSALAVARLSGDRSSEILSALLGDSCQSLEVRRPTLCTLYDPTDGRVLDQALVTVFRGPESYTGEDMVEVSSHGGWLTPALIEEAFIGAGARRAEAGEFTRRAYLNGKLDLVQVEAVLDLIDGQSRAIHEAAIFQLERGLSLRLADLKERLLRLEAHLVQHIDFPEEDAAPMPPDSIASEADTVAGALEELLATAPEGELLREGAVTVLAGRPNSGKSSLFNAMLGVERAIVTEVPGTTRDALESVISLGGFPFRLVDTAGIHETDERVERLGVEVARRYLDAADLVLLCVEAGRPLGEDEAVFAESLAGKEVVMVRTKADLADASGESSGGDDQLLVSAVTGQGLARLREKMPSLVFRGLVSAGVDAPVLTRKRQADGVRRALESVRAFAVALREGVPAELASTHLRPAESALEELLGVISSEDVLDALFEEFCIGK